MQMIGAYLKYVVANSEVDGLVVCSHSSLLESFRQSGVSVACPCNVLGGRTVLEGEDALSDHFTGGCVEDVDAEHLVGRATAENLDEAISVLVGSCSRVSTEGEDTFLVRDASSLELFFALAYVGDLGASVDDTWDGIIVDVATLTKDVLDGSNALLFGLVSQHLTSADVTNAVNVRHLSLPVVIGDDLSALVHGHTSVLEAEAFGEGTAADTDEADIDIEL